MKHMQTWQALIDDPTHDHGVRSLVPRGGLLVAHVMGVVDLACTALWKRLKRGEKYRALYTFLYHLVDGGSFRAKKRRIARSHSFCAALANNSCIRLRAVVSSTTYGGGWNRGSKSMNETTRAARHCGGQQTAGRARRWWRS